MTNIESHKHATPWRALIEFVADADSVLVATGQFRAAPRANLRVGIASGAVAYDPP